MKRLLIALTLVFSFAVLPAASVAAYNPLQQACSSGGNDSAACQGQNGGADPISGSNGILYKVTKLIALFAGIAAVILIIISGIYFVTAGGEASKIASARSTLIGAIVGVVIVASAQAILTFVLSKV